MEKKINGTSELMKVLGVGVEEKCLFIVIPLVWPPPCNSDH